MSTPDGSSLYTGYQPFGNEELPNEIKDEIAKQEDVTNDLIPAAEQVIGIIHEEISAVSDIRSYVRTLGERASADEVSAEYRARELYIGFLERLENTIAEGVMVMREGKYNQGGQWDSDDE